MELKCVPSQLISSLLVRTEADPCSQTQILQLSLSGMNMASWIISLPPMSVQFLEEPAGSAAVMTEAKRGNWVIGGQGSENLLAKSRIQIGSFSCSRMGCTMKQTR